MNPSGTGQPSTTDAVRLRHLDYAGLRLTYSGATIAIDPPMAIDVPAIVTWTEQERVAGAARSSSALAAPPSILAWLGRSGVALAEGSPSQLGGFVVRSRAYEPIPYATPAEAVRKTVCALRKPWLAANRLCFASQRPPCAPLLLTLDRGGYRIAILGQALHRFVTPESLAALVAWVGYADIVVAGTDYDDEVATGKMLAAFPARVRVVADLTGAIRRKLGLPVRPLKLAGDAAPPGTRRFGPKDTLVVR